MTHNMKPNFSSSEDDDDEETSGSESDEEVSDTESDEKQPQEPKKALIPPPQSANKPQQPDLSSSETEESGSDTDTDTDTDLDPQKAVGTNVESKKISTPPLMAKEKDVEKLKKKTVNEELKKGPDPFSSTEESESDSDTDTDTDTDTDEDSPREKTRVDDSKMKSVSSKPVEGERAKGESKLAKKDESKTMSTPPPANEKNAKKGKQKTVKSQARDQSSSEAEDSDDDTDPNPLHKKSNVVDHNIKTISSKSPKKSNVVDTNSKPMAPVEREGSNMESKLPINDASKTKGKRPPPAPMGSEEGAKKAKKNVTADDDSKKQLFQRLWSEDDEIVILKGMIDYKTERNGENPIADMGAFHEFIKKSIHVDVSRSQLGDKIRRLKKKYVNNASREKDGKERSFSKRHEQKGYELSKLIWGSDNNNNNNNGTKGKKNQSQKNGNPKGSTASLSVSNGVDDKEKMMMEVDKNVDISRFVQYGGSKDSLILPEEIMKAGMELVDGSRRAEMEEKWRKLKQQELVLYVKRLELLREQALLVLEAIDSSGN